MNTADTSDSIEIQKVSLKLASKLIVHLVQNWQEEIKSEMKLWIQIVTYCCEDEQQTDLRLAAADVLVSVAPIFLTNQNLLLGLSDTLLLWKCVTQLLQSEEQIVRDAAAGVIRVALSQESIFRKKDPYPTVASLTAAELMPRAGQNGIGREAAEEEELSEITHPPLPLLEAF
ncbi:UNVERIFIED_CONTAM: hypothetical protein K2H54_045765 [Gekko kuhli]